MQISHTYITHVCTECDTRTHVKTRNFLIFTHMRKAEYLLHATWHSKKTRERWEKGEVVFVKWVNACIINSKTVRQLDSWVTNRAVGDVSN